MVAQNEGWVKQSPQNRPTHGIKVNINASSAALMRLISSQVDEVKKTSWSISFAQRGQKKVFLPGKNRMEWEKEGTKLRLGSDWHVQQNHFGRGWSGTSWIFSLPESEVLILSRVKSFFTRPWLSGTKNKHRKIVCAILLQGSARSESTKRIHLLTRSVLGNRKRISWSQHNWCVCSFCMSVLSCHAKTNKLLDTSHCLLLYQITFMLDTPFCNWAYEVQQHWARAVLALKTAWAKVVSEQCWIRPPQVVELCRCLSQLDHLQAVKPRIWTLTYGAWDLRADWCVCSNPFKCFWSSGLQASYVLLK